MNVDYILILYGFIGDAPNKRELDVCIEGNSIKFVSENNLTPNPIKSILE